MAKHISTLRTSFQMSEEFPWATALLVLITLTILIVGAIAIQRTDSYTLSEYFTDLTRIGIGLGLLAVGRGIRSGLKKRE